MFSFVDSNCVMNQQKCRFIIDGSLFFVDAGFLLVVTYEFD